MSQQLQDNLTQIQNTVNNIKSLFRKINEIGSLDIAEKSSMISCFNELEHIQKKVIASNAGQNPKSDDIDKAKLLFENDVLPLIRNTGEFPDLMIREIRILSWWPAFPKLYTNEYLMFIEKLSLREKLTSNVLKNLLIIYFTEFNFFVKTENLFEINKYFWEHLIKNNKINKNNIWLNWISENKEIYFEKNAPFEIAKIAIESRKNANTKINEIIKDYINNIQGDIFSETLKQVGFICFKNINEPYYLNILLDEIIINPYIEPQQLCELVSKIIFAFNSDSHLNASIRDKIRKNLLFHPQLGDPRIHPENWKLVDPKALKVFKTWLASVDIGFFFNLLFDDYSDPQRRKPFWQQYTSEFVDFRVVVSSRHRYQFSEQLNEARKDGRIFSFLESNNPASCFIIDFGKFYAVEFSLKNNSLYIYNKKDINIDLNKKYFDESELKFKNVPIVKKDDYLEDIAEAPLIRFNHHDRWQYDVRKFFQHMGIYPNKRN